MKRSLAILCLLLSYVAAAEEVKESSAKLAVFDIHVHLREGEASLREYKADVASGGIEVAAAETGRDEIVALLQSERVGDPW